MARERKRKALRGKLTLASPQVQNGAIRCVRGAVEQVGRELDWNVVVVYHARHQEMWRELDDRTKEDRGRQEERQQKKKQKRKRAELGQGRGGMGVLAWEALLIGPPLGVSKAAPLSGGLFLPSERRPYTS